MRLLLVDDQPLIALGLSLLLQDVDFCEFRHAQTVAGGQALFEELRPEVVLIEINLPDGSGIELLRKLKEQNRDAKLAILTVVEDPQTAVKAFDAGAQAFIGKSEALDQVLEALQAIARGDAWLPKRMLQDVAHLRSSDPELSHGLSTREKEILRHLAYGETMNELAHRLDLSYKTVTKECANLRERLGAKSLPELVRIGMQLDLVD